MVAVKSRNVLLPRPSPPSLVSAVRGGLGSSASARGSRLCREGGPPSEVKALCAAPRRTISQGPSEAKSSQERP